MILAAMVAALALALPGVAGAEHTAEHVAQETARLQAAYLPPGAGDSMGVYGVDIYRTYRALSLHDLGFLCNYQGGYYYYAEDGGYYWNEC